ncbi:hypothetical protein N7530_010543 [Penicillium desertorum]|uniref:Uncharacterized protein n=1 Tax=Penicillium desertorum TaxID=1303715 RepID=A0A9X0BHU5_9EURO|nr:hypothetical protein N7530_010543 [Penicillium desertorum]
MKRLDIPSSHWQVDAVVDEELKISMQGSGSTLSESTFGVTEARKPDAESCVAGRILLHSRQKWILSRKQNNI